MKRLWLGLCLFLLCFGLVFTPVAVKAEEVEQPETSETEEQEMTFDEFKEKAQDWIAEYTGESIAVKIISWAIDAGVLSALFVVCLKYRKYKSTTVEDMITLFKGQIKDHLKENFDSMSAEEIGKVVSKIDDLLLSNETIMKVLVLAQDSSTKGKAALIDYLGSKTKSEEVKQAAEEVNNALVKEEQVKAEIVDKVSGDYKDIF